MAARILIVDGDPSGRTTIRSLLDWHGFHVWGEAKDRKEAIKKIIELKPDIVLLDVNTPGVSVKAAEEIRQISAETKIVLLTVDDVPEAAATTQMVEGFVPKSAAGTKLIPMLDRLLGISLEGGTKSRRATMG